MPPADFDQDWEQASKDLLTGMKEWRVAHPRATLSTIEQELDRRMNQLRAEMLEDLAQASALTDVCTLAEEERPVCPECGARLGARGQQARQLSTTGNEMLTLRRSYMVCPHCQVGFFPLDEELGLLPGSLTPRLQGHVTQLGSWLPFGRVGVILQDMLGVHVSEPTVRRCTEGHGAAYEAVQTAAVAELERDLPEPPQGPAKQLLSVDGAMIPLVGGEWAEVKTLVLGDIREPVMENGEWGVHSTNLSYFSRLTDSDSFQRLALVETQRRGVETAQQVIAPSDGALWIQGFLDYHRRDAVRVLDFGHAAEHVAVLGRAVGEPDSATFKTWLHHNLHRLKHEGGTAILPELQVHVDAHPERPELAEALAYLENRAAMMAYPEFQAQGWPIGSGSVESGNKLVVEARLKGAGMHWARPHVNPMLSLRNAVCSARWDEAWQEIGTYHQQQRRQRYLARVQRPTVTPLPPPVAAAPVVTSVTPAKESAPVSKQPWRPAADHPWKRAPSCTPSRRSCFAKL